MTARGSPQLLLSVPRQGPFSLLKPGTAPSGEVTPPENRRFLINAREWLMRNLHDVDRAEVEAIASGRTITSGRLDVSELGSARAELVRRDQEYAEQQEKIRQEFEREMERSRSEREKSRQELDAALARENRETTKEAVRLLANATRETAERQVRILRLATWAAVASALAALFALAITIIHAIK